MAKTLEKSRQPTKRASAPLTLESPIRQYDVCLSFAGEDRGYVEKTAKALGRLKVSVFYDRYEQSQLWGKDLYAHLDIVYRLKATFCIVFISENYAKKLWTNHERRSAQARAFLENDEYILPVRMDDAQIPGILPTVGYVDARRLTPQKLARLVSEKLETLNSNARVPKTANSEYQRILYESFDFVGFSSKQIREHVQGKWLVGKRGCWQGRMARGKYILANRTKMVATLNNQLTYRTNDNEVVDLGEGRVSVRVRLLPPFSENTGGGLFFRGSLTSTTYLAFYRKAGRAYSLCKIVDGKLENIWTDEISQIDDKEFCQLSISGCGNRIELSVDAAIVFAYTCKSIHGPTVGVSVLGTGLFEFDDFAMYSRR